MKKIVFLLSVFLLSSGLLQAQSKSTPYGNSVGGTVGFINGFSYKGFLSSDFAIQLDAGVSWNLGIDFNTKVNLNFMYETFAASHLYWFIGGGLNCGVGLVSENQYLKGSKLYGASVKNHYPFFVGVGLIGGIEYKCPKIPLTIQVDLRPGIYFYTHKENTEVQGFTDKYSYKTVFKPGYDINFLNVGLRYTIMKKNKMRSSVKRGGSIKTTKSKQ
ncbi:MAG: hypothetical protein MJZ76_04380 [Bacteroidales bacterium]|nr:hypothetical protein [Bacteroidales bacterium]